MDAPLFIAEVKTKSPFGFESEHSWEDLFEIAAKHGDAVAIHTSHRWGGSFAAVQAAREKLLRRKLVVAKGIHPYDEEIRIALYRGADLVTVVGRMPPRELAPVCIWEPKNLPDLMCRSTSLKVMWNQRDLQTGDPHPQVFAEARDVHRGWLCQASYIKTPEDVNLLADAFIVGEHLPTFVGARDPIPVRDAGCLNGPCIRTDGHAGPHFNSNGEQWVERYER